MEKDTGCKEVTDVGLQQYSERIYDDFLSPFCAILVGQIILEVLSNEGITVTKIEKSISLEKHIKQILERSDPINFKMREIKRSCML